MMIHRPKYLSVMHTRINEHIHIILPGHTFRFVYGFIVLLLVLIPFVWIPLNYLPKYLNLGLCRVLDPIPIYLYFRVLV
jgi:hypothetical protein